MGEKTEEEKKKEEERKRKAEAERKRKEEAEKRRKQIIKENTERLAEKGIKPGLKMTVIKDFEAKRSGKKSLVKKGWTGEVLSVQEDGDVQVKYAAGPTGAYVVTEDDFANMAR